MPRFAYKARDPSGNSVDSAIDAPSRKDALRLLSARGLSVGAVSEASGAAAAATALPRSRAKAPAPESAARTSLGLGARGDNTPRKAERLPFLESLHELTSSGLSGGEAVRLLSMRFKEPRQRALCEGLWARLSEGAPLSRAMEAYPQVFDTSTTNLIRAGEATGNLSDTLARLIQMLVEQRELKMAVLTAMAYPLVIVRSSIRWGARCRCRRES
jgi:general secretion pathway protein F